MYNLWNVIYLKKKKFYEIIKIELYVYYVYVISGLGCRF